MMTGEWRAAVRFRRCSCKREAGEVEGEKGGREGKGARDWGREQKGLFGMSLHFDAVEQLLCTRNSCFSLSDPCSVFMAFIWCLFFCLSVLPQVCMTLM